MTQPPSPAAYSRYLARLLQARPELACETVIGTTPLTAPLLDAWLAETPLGEDNLKSVLRRIKQRALARIMSRDLSGQADLAEVVESMTLLAERTIAAALAVCETSLVARYGAPKSAKGERQQLIVIGMGKLGGRELNVSSDIDLIFVYPEDGETDGPRPISNFEFFARLGKALIQALAEITADGQVFRVDMRLRPNGDSGPLVSSFETVSYTHL
ncbi:MAG: bifunctional glutamine synthetase adenylyltransferase/deadenyltransferase, partial [Rhodocyclaceae bacterium]|nr:bifunctional glutamine synthetase adenylyltransferase/deadenyltransferase [Rhodocyclaceae bacterium]